MKLKSVSEMMELKKDQRAFQGNVSHLQLILNALENDTPKRWNDWRKLHSRTKPDLRGINLWGARLSEFNLRGAQLEGADLSNVAGWEAQLTDANLEGAWLERAELIGANLNGANLDSARLLGANLTGISAKKATFRNANLSHSVLNGARLQGADLTAANVTGINAWAIEVDEHTTQKDLAVRLLGDLLEDISDDSGLAIEGVGVRIQNLQAAHLLHLVTADRTKVIINSLTDLVVLLLGNFSVRQKAILKDLRRRLVELGYAPVVFDFEVNRDLIDGVTVLAGLSKFVIADLTKATSTPLESLLITSQFMIPFAPIIRKSQRPFSMFASLQTKYDWVLPTWEYRDRDHLIRNLERRIVNPCEEKIIELNSKRHAIASFTSNTRSKKRRLHKNPRS